MKVLSLLPSEMRARLVYRFNHRYAIIRDYQRRLPNLAEAYCSSYLIGRQTQKPSLLSKLIAIYLIDFRAEDEELTKAIARQFSKTSNRYVQFRVGDRMLRARLYIPATRSFLKAACEANFEVNATFRYLDYMTQVYGYDHPEIARITRRFRRPRFRQALTRSQRVKACAILLKRRDKQLSHHFYMTVPQSHVRRGALPLFIQRNAVKNRWRNYEYQRRGAEQYTSIVSGREDFKDLILDNAESFCIVGNGPSEIGKGKGALIDSNNVVIRINSYDISNPDDYGSKQTVWVRVANDEADANHIQTNSHLIIASNHFEYKRIDADRYLLQPYLLGRSMATIPSNVFQELMGELKCLPSTGLAILYWIYKISGRIPREKLFGFSHLDEVGDFRSHYYQDKIERRVHVHAWEKEMAVIARITK